MAQPLEELVSRIAGLPVDVVRLLGRPGDTQGEFLIRLGRARLALEESRPKTLTQTIVFLVASDLIDEERAVSRLLDSEIPAAEQWAELLVDWTPEERAEMVKALESDGWNAKTLAEVAT